LATLTAAQPPGRYGAFKLGSTENKITAFKEKPNGDGAWVNSGFFVLEPGVMDYIDGDATTWEKEPMEKLATNGELAAYKHSGFWQPMDSLRDKHVLEDLWQSGKAPWKIW
jgi:glucose-1-phosphate cytidylyltransferase